MHIAESPGHGPGLCRQSAPQRLPCPTQQLTQSSHPCPALGRSASAVAGVMDRGGRRQTGALWAQESGSKKTLAIHDRPISWHHRTKTHDTEGVPDDQRRRVGAQGITVVTNSNQGKRVFDLVKDFGTSQSPKSTRSSTTITAPAALRALPCNTPRWFALQDNSHKWLDAIVGCLLCFPFGAQAHVGQTVRPNRFRGLTAFASLSMAVSEGKSDFEMLPDVLATLAPFAEDFPGLEEKVRRDLSYVFLQVEQEMFE